MDDTLSPANDEGLRPCLCERERDDDWLSAFNAQLVSTQRMPLGPRSLLRSRQRQSEAEGRVPSEALSPKCPRLGVGQIYSRIGNGNGWIVGQLLLGVHT